MRTLCHSQQSQSFAVEMKIWDLNALELSPITLRNCFTRSLLLVNWPKAPGMVGISSLLWCPTKRLLLGTGVRGWSLLRSWSSYFCLYKHICLGNGFCFCPQQRLLVPGQKEPKTKRWLCTRLLASTTAINVHVTAEVFVHVFHGWQSPSSCSELGGSECHLSITARHKVTLGCRTPGLYRSSADVHVALQNRRETSAWIHWKYHMTAQQKLVL